MTTIRLCHEGHRLWVEWQAEHWNYNWLSIDGDRADATRKANAAWKAYQDHRAACQECTKVEVKE